MHIKENKPKPTHFALIDGNIVPFDAAAFRDNAYDPAIFEYIGAGVIHSIRGVLQESTTETHFWIYKTSHPCYGEDLD